ncbi:MAG: AI-2E family transporter [Actinomycetaceae bacterium]|nr:AI-2E family transporter [Actinomycetaceae bacterium]
MSLDEPAPLEAKHDKDLVVNGNDVITGKDDAQVADEPSVVCEEIALEKDVPDTAESSDAHTDGNNGEAGKEFSGANLINSSLSDYPVGVKAIVGLALVTVACIGINQVQSLIAPAFFALTLVLTVRPIQRALVRKNFPQWLAGTIAIIVLIVALVAVGGLLTWSMAGLPEKLSSYSYRAEALVNDVFSFAGQYGFSTERIQEEITKNFSVSSIISALGSVMSSLTSTGAAFIVIAIALIFLTMDMGNLSQRSWLVDSRDSGLFSALSAFEGRVRQYWLVSSIFGFIVAVIDGIALVFLGVPMPVAWAMLSFITNYIPNIGFVLGLVPPALLALVDQGPLTALWVIIAYSVINVVIQSFIQPKFTGDAVGLTPTATFVSLLFWAIVLGPLGTILAVPLTLFAKAILVDASPQTRWLDAFLVPDDEVKKKKRQGFYDEKSPAPDVFAHLASVTFHLGNRFHKRAS